MAGLTAARTLAEAGRTVTLLEASSRVDGRIHPIGKAMSQMIRHPSRGKPSDERSLLAEME